MCDENKMYYAYGEIIMPTGNKQVIQLKYQDGADVYNTPSRLKMTLSGSNPNMKQVMPINYNGLQYVPNSGALYNTNNCTAGILFFGDKMIFPYVPSNQMNMNMNMYAGKKRIRNSRKKTKKTRKTRRRRTMKKY
jgi:hypothetical protein